MRAGATAELFAKIKAKMRAGATAELFAKKA